MAPMKAAYPRVSFADLEKWPEDRRRYELYDGEVYEVPSPFPLHQMASAALHLALAAYVREHGGIVLYAPLDIVLTDYDVVQPDLLLFTRERQHLIDARKTTRVPPDLAIEILSASTAANDRGRKKQLLARHGVREFWLVDPEAQTVEVYTLSGSALVLVHTASRGARVESPLLPALQLSSEF
jgi:Uma2 family endonuclease